MLVWFVIAPVLIALFIYIIPFKNAGKIIAIAAQAALTCFAFYIFLLCKNGDVIERAGNYSGTLGIMLKADTLSSVFVILTSFIFLIAAINNFHDRTGRLFWFLLFVWEGLLSGIFLSCDFFNIFVLIEVATVVVSILIMFKQEKRSMYDGMVYLMANTVAIQFFLFGAGYIYKLTGTLDMDSAALAIKSLDKSALMLPYALIMTSVSLKCALMPLFSWLPRAHGTRGAPSVVSAILSGLHIKSGIFLFIRFQAIFQDASVPGFFLVAGIITGIAGFIFALSQSDIKLVLAYSTISQIGMIMIGLNASGMHSYTGSVYHIINHAVFKSALFLCAGVIIDIYGTGDIYKIRGVFRRVPVVGTAAIMAILGITGAPFFNGSISKYFIMSDVSGIVNGTLLFINLGTIITFAKFSAMFFGEGSERGAVKVAAGRQAAVLILGVLCLAGGIFGEKMIGFLFNTRVYVEAAGYLQKVLFFFLSVIAGYLIYRYFVKNSGFFRRIRGLELSFRGICVSMGLFFAVLLFCVRLSG